MHEAIFEYRFSHFGGTVGQRIKHTKLSLHVRWKIGIRRGCNADRLGTLTVHVQRYPVVSSGDIGSAFAQFFQNTRQNSGHRIEHADLAAGHRRTNQKCAGFYAVRHNTVFTALQLFHTLNSDGAGAGTFDFCPHGDEVVGKVSHLRFPRRVFQDRCATGQSRRHQQIFCTRHRYRVEGYVRALQSIRFRPDIATIDGNLSTEGTQSVNM